MLAIATSTGYAAQPPWLRSLEEGRKAAQDSGKSPLIVFTGFGWCAACEILDREVFQKPEFVEACRSQFVFVELDFNFGETVEEQRRKAQYDDLAEQYLISTYPTVIVADNTLRPFGYFIGYEDSYGPERYLDNIRSARNDYQFYFDASQRLTLSPNSVDLKAYAKALANVAAHLDVDEDRADPLIQFYSSDVARILSDLPEADEGRRLIASRQKNQLLRAERESIWEPIANHLDALYAGAQWDRAVDYIKETLPTLSDPYLQLRLELQYLIILDRDNRYAEALALSRRLQNQTNLDYERRRRIGNLESRLLLKLGKVDEAIALYDERIAAAEQAGDQSQRSWLLAWKAQLMLSTDRLAETIAVCRASREAAQYGSDDWLTASFLLAIKLREAGQFEEAIRLSTEQFEAHPQGNAMLDIAESLIGLKRLGDALPWLERAESEAARLRESARKGDRDSAEHIAKRAASLRNTWTSTNC